ncbi:MAG: carbamoyltransferase HypF, partial [Acidobacteria bacterium]|nr:carbamoyltransferase HypF [Acidobacteriota bacterium]
MPHETYRITVDMEGILQGVGFRPTVQRLAALAGLSGWVQNRSGSVRMVLGGSREDVLRFVTELPAKLPPRARLDRLTTSEPQRQNGEVLPHPFAILESAHDEATKISIPADLASCASCRAEVFDPRSRYYRYPFTTCTDCGPRYTVVDGMPYDRERTALSLFPLCDACQAEYRDPTNRRFHAESIACPRCGPRSRCRTRRACPSAA